MELDLGKISTIIGIVGALSASVGGYFVMEERQNVMMEEVKMLRESTSNIDLGAMKAKLDDIISRVSALDARVADSNPAEFTRKVERLEERLNNVIKALDRIQDNENPLSM
jgi:acetolactate synthase small subunit